MNIKIVLVTACLAGSLVVNHFAYATSNCNIDICNTAAQNKKGACETGMGNGGGVCSTQYQAALKACKVGRTTCISQKNGTNKPANKQIKK